LRKNHMSYLRRVVVPKKNLNLTAAGPALQLRRIVLGSSFL
jgi:hypothetical protein